MSSSLFPTDDQFDLEADLDIGSKQSQNKIHVRIQQRNGRKTITTVQGIDEKYDQKKLAKAMKKEFNCNGTVTTDEEYGECIQLTGDQRENIKKFLIHVTIAKEPSIVIHGF